MNMGLYYIYVNIKKNEAICILDKVYCILKGMMLAVTTSWIVTAFNFFDGDQVVSVTAFPFQWQSIKNHQNNFSSLYLYYLFQQCKCTKSVIEINFMVGP